MSLTFIQDETAASSLAETLSVEWRIALDLEAAGFHRYSDRVCLIQLSLASGRTYLIDPLAFDPRELLAPVLEHPEVQVIMHGADFDLRLLDRDLDIQLAGLFDTQAAAAILGERALGLSSLLEKHLDVSLAKKYQRADWAKRPLPSEMAEYAAEDTRHLHRLAGLLEERLEEKGRAGWARGEFRDLESIRFERDEDVDPVTSVKRAWELEPRALERLRAALEWRDEIARKRDRAHFRVAGDSVLEAAAVERPRSQSALAALKGMSSSLARDEGRELLARFDRVDEMAEDELRPYPAREASGGRPPREVEERTGRLKSVRNRRASELGIDRGTLLPNATLQEIAQEIPQTREALVRIPGVKEWQIEAAGDELLAVLAGEEAA